MAVNYSVPFYENTADDTHCVQACYRMVLKYYWPEEDYSWDQLDKITAKQPGMWTWPMAGLCWFVDNGYEVVYIEDFDYSRFKNEGEEYLVERYGKEVAVEQLKNSKIEKEFKWTELFLNKVAVQDRAPELEEIIDLLEKKYLIVAMVNSRSLYGKEGYVGHAVVVKGYDDGIFTVHDPGRPGLADHELSFEQFIEGWSYPDKSSNNITAIKLKASQL